MHHIVPVEKGGKDDLGNAIPVCFDCHAHVGHYNYKHPRGSKYHPKELQARRDQIYEEFTSHLIPPVEYALTQKLPNGAIRELPSVGFVISHLGARHPVHVRVVVSDAEGNKDIARTKRNEKMYSPLYSGEQLWRLNPRNTIRGHFTLKDELVEDTTSETSLEVAVWIIDQYEYEHKNLPIEFGFHPEVKDWYLKP